MFKQLLTFLIKFMLRLGREFTVERLIGNSMIVFSVALHLSGYSSLVARAFIDHYAITSPVLFFSFLLGGIALTIKGRFSSTLFLFCSAPWLFYSIFGLIYFWEPRDYIVIAYLFFVIFFIIHIYIRKFLTEFVSTYIDLNQSVGVDDADKVIYE